MDPDNYQQAWQADAAQTRVTIDADLLRKEVQRAERSFRAVIFWRDFREVGIALLMIPVWFYLGAMTSSPWTWYLTVPVLVWIPGFILVDRMRHKHKPSDPGEPLLHCVKESLTQLEHQTWLLRNIFWWYLLPPSISLMVFFADVFWRASSAWWEFLVAVVISGFGLFVVYASIYFLNQRTIRKQLEPRRQELLTLLISLCDKTTGEDADDHVALPALPFAADRLRMSCTSPARVVIGMIALVVVALLLVFIINVDLDDYPKQSPFAAVRWQESQPEVKLGEEWFKLVSLDEIPASEIVAFSQRTEGNIWRKRFEEDLVELLTRMGHPPQDEVTLVVQSLTSSETWVRKDVPMTKANRTAIRNAAQKRARQEQPRDKKQRDAVSIENAEQFRERVNEFLQIARFETGFSGVVVVARGGVPVYQGAFGFSHLNPQTPNSLDTPFRIASLSKQFTAAGVLFLEAEGKLNIDAPVHRYLPEFAAEPYREITIHQLLTHTSGLPRTPENLARHLRWQAMSEAQTPVNDYVALACQCPLKFEPGQAHLYSNLGYRVLSALITRVTGKEYADFMQESLFAPLGLSHSGVARISQPRDEAIVAEELSFVALDEVTREPTHVRGESGRNYGTGYGSGGIYASANDLLRWDRVLAGDSFLSVEQKAKLFRPDRDHYAYGWIVKKSGLDGRLYQTHSGANEGYFSKMMRLPEDDLVIIALGNVRATDELDVALEQLFRLCRSLPYQDF